MLAAYYTVLPAARTRGVEPRLVRRHVALAFPVYASMRGWLPISAFQFDRLAERAFDRWAMRHYVPADVAHAVVGLGRRYRRMAKGRFGALSVCDATTSHIRGYQTLLAAEHRKWGVPLEWDERTTAAVEEEYVESDLILAPSRFAYESFVAGGVPASKLALVPYGVDTDEFRPVPKRDETFRILFVGTLSLRKGLPYLLESVATLRWPNAELVLRGTESPETRTLLNSYRGTIPISLVPPQPRSTLKELYSSASVLVLPSIEDAFGIVIGQALACGTPVIATTHTGGPDVIDNGANGFIIPPADVAALRRALTDAYENRAMLTDMRGEARRRVEAARGWDTYGDGVVAALRQALDRRDRACLDRRAGT